MSTFSLYPFSSYISGAMNSGVPTKAVILSETLEHKGDAYTNHSVLLPKTHLGRPHITDFDFTMRSVDEDIVTFNIAMNDWRRVTMQVI